MSARWSPRSRPQASRWSSSIPGPRQVPLTELIIVTNNIVMSKVNIFEIKARFSEYVDRAVSGEHVVICRHNKPVAELRAVEGAQVEPRPIGPLPGRPTFDVPSSFFEPMADDELEFWEGKEGVAASIPTSRRASKAAESKSAYRSRRRRTP